MDPPSLQRFTSDDVKAAVSRVLLPKLMDREDRTQPTHSGKIPFRHI